MPAAVFFIEALGLRLCPEVEGRWGHLHRQAQQPAADPLPLIVRQHQQFRDGAEEAAIGEDAQAAHQRVPVIGGEVYGPFKCLLGPL